MARISPPTTAQRHATPAFTPAIQNAAIEPVSVGTLIRDTLAYPDFPEQAPRVEPTTSRLPIVPLAGHNSENRSPNFVVAVDFGTTYSTVAFVKSDAGTDLKLLGVDEIRCIANYRNVTGNGPAREKARNENVPTDILYLAKTSEGLDSEVDSDDSDLGQEVDHVCSQPPPLEKGKSRKRSKPDSQPRLIRQAFIKWGYGVPRYQEEPLRIDEKSGSEIVKLIKVHLDEDSLHTKDLRTELGQQVERLQSHGFVRDRDHIISDYLTRLLRHTKSILTRNEDLCPESKIDFVLCVPVNWSEVACRAMHNAMARAIRNSGLGLLQHDIITDLFMVSEAEAAAQYVLTSLGEKGRLQKGEVFVLLDAGGGTVDVTTYQVTSDTGPLRLQGEIVKAEGALCGSSFINKRHAKKLTEKLEGEDYDNNKKPLKTYVDAIVSNWEVNGKPDIDIDDRRTMRSCLKRHIPGLKENPEKNFKSSLLCLTEQEIKEMFEPSLTGTTDLLERQLDAAFERRFTVTKVIVVGGFGESPSLQRRLNKLVESKWNLVGSKIDIIWPDRFPTSAVARGAILRSLNKDNGPTRHSRASFGFLQTEQYDARNPRPEYIEAEVQPSIDPIDGYANVKNTIYWVIQAVRITRLYATSAMSTETQTMQGPELPTVYESNPILSCHTFALEARELICVEYLYSSPREQRSHFQLQHPENKGLLPNILPYPSFCSHLMTSRFCMLELKSITDKAKYIRRKMCRPYRNRYDESKGSYNKGGKRI